MSFIQDGLGVPAGVAGVSDAEQPAPGPDGPTAVPPVHLDGQFLRTRAGWHPDTPTAAPAAATGRLDEALMPETVPEPPTGIQVPRATLSAAPKAPAATE
jgi:hypothetical protein